MKHVRRMTARHETGPVLAGIDDILDLDTDANDLSQKLASALGVSLIATPFGKFVKLPGTSPLD
ncbi:hypothetical protein ACFL1X_07120 [Candidatus Hydrogenedentota bacterium]